MASARTPLQSAQQFKKEMESIDEILMHTGSVNLEDLRAARDTRDEQEQMEDSKNGHEQASSASKRNNWFTEMLEDLAKCQDQETGKSQRNFTSQMIK